jgi:peroxiredoxin
MNSKVMLVTLLLLPAGFCMAQDSFQISGKLSAEGKVILNYVNQEGKRANDTVLLKDGKFIFNGTTAFANKAYLSVEKKSDYQEFYLEKGKYKVIGKDSLSNAEITGTQSQRDYLQYNAWMGTMPAQWKVFIQRAQKVIAAKDTAALTLIQVEARVLHARMEATLDSFVFSHPDSYVSLDLINENKTSVIDPKVFDPYYTALSKRVLASFTGKKLTEKYDKARQVSIGKAFDFTQQDTTGKPFTLSSLKGKYVLVDFWASWCAPCRAENPNLLKSYNQLKARNFEVVAISLDENRNAWLKAVEKDGLPWMQVSDLKGWKNEVATKYGITAVPQNLLIDPNGVIIAKNLRGEQLYTELDKLIK